MNSTTTFWERRLASGEVKHWTTNESIMTENFDLDGPQGMRDAQITHLMPPIMQTAAEAADLRAQSQIGRLEGQPVSMLFATRRMRRIGQAVSVRRTGGEYVATAVTDSVVSRMTNVRMWTFWPAAMLGFVIAASTGVLSGIFANTSPNLRGMFGFFIGGLLWFAVFAIGSVVRNKRFNAVQLSKLHALLD